MRLTTGGGDNPAARRRFAAGRRRGLGGLDGPGLTPGRPTPRALAYRPAAKRLLHLIGVSSMLRKKISAPSDWRRILPLVASALLPSLTSLPLTSSLMVSPLQVMTYLFHSPIGFSTPSLIMRK